MPQVIHHDAATHRFEVRGETGTAVLDYTLNAGVMTITHTGVPQAMAGRGIAGELVQAAMTAAREHGWKVVPACSYAAAWLQRHAGYDDLLA